MKSQIRLGACLLFLFPLCLTAAELISVNSTGNDSGDASSFVSSEDYSPFSSDGRYLIFSSGATDLGPTDTNATFDAYLRDRQTGTTQLISANMAGTDSGNASSFARSISSDGRYVVFTSDASDLVPTDTNGVGDFFIRDRNTNTTTLISKNLAGTDSANASGFGSTLTPDGRFVVFNSNASDLVATDTNGMGDVFLYSVIANSVTLVSINDAGTDSGNAASEIRSLSSVSDDGRYIVIESDATDLIAADANGNKDVFLYDAMAVDITRISNNLAGTAGGNGASDDAIISGDGSRIVFSSAATDLVATTDLNATADFFAYDRLADSMAMVTINATGTASATGGTHIKEPRINENGQFLVFESSATDLTNTTDNNGTDDMFLRDLVIASTILISTNAAGTESANGQVDDPQISLNGALVYYETTATNVVTIPDNNMQKDTYVYSRILGANYLLSVNSLGTATGNDFCYDPAQSADGLIVSADCGATDIVSGVADTNAATDVYVFRVFDVLPASTGGGGGVFHPGLGLLFLMIFVLSRSRCAKA